MLLWINKVTDFVIDMISFSFRWLALFQAHSLKAQTKYESDKVWLTCLHISQGPRWQRCEHLWMPHSRTLSQLSPQVGTSSVQGNVNSRWQERSTSKDFLKAKIFREKMQCIVSSSESCLLFLKASLELLSNSHDK